MVPGFGQRDRHAGEVLGGQLPVAGAPHDVLIGGDELAEVHGLGILDAGHDELPTSVFALQVDGQAQIRVGGRDDVRLAVHFGEVPVHVRELLGRLHDRVPEQVGERDLAAAGALEVVVDDDAVVDHQLRRDRAHAGGGRHIQRRRHVLDDGGGRAAKHLGLVVGAATVDGRQPSGQAWPLHAGCWRRRGRPGARGGLRAGFGGACLRCPTARSAGRCRSAPVSSRRGTRANSGRPRKDRPGTCGTSPRPATRFARMVKVNCSRRLLASIPLPGKRRHGARPPCVTWAVPLFPPS